MNLGFVRPGRTACLLFAVLLVPALGKSLPAKPLAVYVLEVDTNIKGEFGAAAPALTLALESAFSRKGTVFQVLDRRHLNQIVKANQLEKDLQAISRGAPASRQFAEQVQADGFIRGELADGPDGAVLTLTITRLNSEILWQGTAKRTKAEWQLQRVQAEEAEELVADAAAGLKPADQPLSKATPSIDSSGNFKGDRTQPSVDKPPSQPETKGALSQSLSPAAAVSAETHGFVFVVEGCNRIGDVLTCSGYVNNRLKRRMLDLNAQTEGISSVVDNRGMQYSLAPPAQNTVVFGESGRRQDLENDLPINFAITLQNFSAAATSASLLLACWTSEPYGFFNVTLRKIPVTSR